MPSPNLVYSKSVHFLYSLFLFLCLLVYAPVYFFRMRVARGERLFVRERLGFRLPPREAARPTLWIHAVSVGEVLSLRNLLAQVKKRHPSWRICFSTLTPTGYRIAKEKLTMADIIFFVPLDFALIVRRFFKALKPKLFLLAESEFWPNLLRIAGKKCQAVLLLNGRMSQDSFKTYRRLRPLAVNVLKNIDFFLMQTEQDRRRIEDIGIDPKKVKVAGNLKAEVSLPLLNQEDRQAFEKNLGISGSKKVIVAGSTHRGEEELILEAFGRARKEKEGLLLIIAPRHPDRAREVEKLGLNHGLSVLRKTAATPGQAWDVLILDTIGELAYFYALADLTFVGGSLVPHGGQNFMEPAFYEKPVLCGPHLENFAALADEFIHSGGIRVVRGIGELTEAFKMKDETALEEIGRRAKNLLNSHQGATERTLQAIEKFMAEHEVRT